MDNLAKDFMHQFLSYSTNHEIIPFMQQNGPQNIFSFQVNTNKAPPNNRMPVRGENYTFTYVTDNYQQWQSKNSTDVMADFDEETEAIKTHWHMLDNDSSMDDLIKK